CPCGRRGPSAAPSRARACSPCAAPCGAFDDVGSRADVRMPSGAHVYCTAVSGKSEEVSLLSPAFVRVTVANFCFFLTFASFFLLPLHVRALGGSERTVGFVMGTNGVAGLVSIFLVGPVLDRVDRVQFLRLGLGVMLL